MAGSLAEIANLALTWLGERTIVSLEDNSVAAEIVRSNERMIRRALLSRNVWSFATTRTLLPALAEAPVHGFAYAYQLPADCLRVVEPDDEHDRFALEGGKLLTDLAAPLRFVYVADVEDTSRWHPLFDEAFAMRLAEQLAEPLTQSRSKAADAGRAAEKTLRTARRVNAIQKPPRDLGAQSPWLDAR